MMRLVRSLLFWAIIAAMFVSAFWVGMALAHTDGPGAWINRESLTDPVTKQFCCNEHDCREEPDNVEAIDGGYRIRSTGEFIPAARVIWRSPGGWWRCRYLASHALPEGKRIGDTRCLIGPPPSG